MIHKDVKAAIKEAEKKNDNIKVECLNDLIDKAVELANSKRYNVNLNAIQDDIMVDAIRKEIGRLKNEHVNNKAKIDILKSYMPVQLSRREAEEEISWILASGVYETYGQRMKAVMRELGGRANTRVIRDIVNAYNVYSN